MVACPIRRVEHDQPCVNLNIQLKAINGTSKPHRCIIELFQFALLVGTVGKFTQNDGYLMIETE